MRLLSAALTPPPPVNSGGLIIAPVSSEVFINVPTSRSASPDPKHAFMVFFGEFVSQLSPANLRAAPGSASYLNRSYNRFPEPFFRDQLPPAITERKNHSSFSFFTICHLSFRSRSRSLSPFQAP